MSNVESQAMYFTPELVAGIVEDIRQEIAADLANSTDANQTAAIAQLKTMIKLEIARRMNNDPLIRKYEAERQQQFTDTFYRLSLVFQGEVLNKLIAEEDWFKNLLRKDMKAHATKSQSDEPPKGDGS